MGELVIELDRTLRAQYGDESNKVSSPIVHFSERNHWTNSILCKDDNETDLGRSLLSFTIAAGLYQYAHKALKCKPGCGREMQASLLLDYALRSNERENVRIQAGISAKQIQPHLGCIRLILKHGANPNDSALETEHTVWEMLLENLASSDQTHRYGVWPQVIERLIRAGATRRVNFPAIFFKKKKQLFQLEHLPEDSPLLYLWEATDYETDWESASSLSSGEDSTSDNEDTAHGHASGSDNKVAVQMSSLDLPVTVTPESQDIPRKSDALYILSLLFAEESVQIFRLAFDIRARRDDQVSVDQQRLTSGMPVGEYSSYVGGRYVHM